MPQLSFLPWLVAFILCIPALLFVLYPVYRPYQRIPAGMPDVLDELDRSADQATLPSQLENEQAARHALKEVDSLRLAVRCSPPDGLDDFGNP